MATNRTYNDMCGLAHALDLVGERWALLVVRELVLGPRRYTELRAELPGISNNVLADRLDGLVNSGVATTRTLPPPAGSTVYELTGWGHELEPIITRLGRWGARSPEHPAGEHLSANSLILSLRTNFDADAAGGFDRCLDLHLGREPFRVHVSNGVLRSGRRSDSDYRDPDATVESSPITFAQLLYGGRDPDEAIASGDVGVAGDATALRDFLEWFELPRAPGEFVQDDSPR